MSNDQQVAMIGERPYAPQNTQEHEHSLAAIFLFALVGGLIAPATLGYAASWWGVGVVLGLPLIGTFMVMALLVLIWLESKVTGR